MAIIIRPANPNVPYAGKILPQDKVPYSPPITNPDVNYAAKVLPQDTVKYIPIPTDQTNQPSLVVLGNLGTVASPFGAYTVTSPPPVTGASLPNGGVVLPADVVLRGDVEKVLAQTVIVDGVSVTEHIRRKPWNLEMEFTIRAKDNNQWIFGQVFLDALYQNILVPETVIFVQNTVLNKLGITQMVIEKMSFETVRGSINIPMVFRFIESVPGQSLIVPISQ